MDWVTQAAPQVEEEVFWSVVSLLDLEVDLLFFDTTSTYFETVDADAPVACDARGMPVPDTAAAPPQAAEAPAVPDGVLADTPAAADAARSAGSSPEAGAAGLRAWGKSKDSRGDLPQMVIGMAVTRTGNPVRAVLAG